MYIRTHDGFLYIRLSFMLQLCTDIRGSQITYKTPHHPWIPIIIIIRTFYPKRASPNRIDTVFVCV